MKSYVRSGRIFIRIAGESELVQSGMECWSGDSEQFGGTCAIASSDAERLADEYFREMVQEI